MDHQTFDRLTRLVGTTGSRRTAWRALLAGALLGAAPRRLAAAPTTPCAKGKHELCGGQCCPGKCFTNGACTVCCTKPDFVICRDPAIGKPTDPASGKAICCQNTGRDACEHCEPPSGCPEAITGTYRRR